MTNEQKKKNKKRQLKTRGAGLRSPCPRDGGPGYPRRTITGFVVADVSSTLSNTTSSGPALSVRGGEEGAGELVHLSAEGFE